MPRLLLILALAALAALNPIAQAGSVPPIDPQRWQDQEEMTWNDYRPIPGANWSEAKPGSARNFRVALIAVDFADQPFVITLPKKSDLFGNPQTDPVKREDVPWFYADFWGRPNALNHGHTIHEYWMEQSRGRVGIPTVDAYGPYRMPKNLFQYGLREHGQELGCPTGFTCDGRMEPDVDALWLAAAGADIKSKYDIILRIYAGYDETSVWQEFGEMKFASRDDIPAEWGNPDPTKPRWVPTRYVPWTSWKAGRSSGAFPRYGKARARARSRTRSRTSRFKPATTTTIRTRSRTGGSDPARGTSWTAGRSTGQADRIGGGSFRRTRGLRYRRGSCCATACGTSSSGASRCCGSVAMGSRSPGSPWRPLPRVPSNRRPARSRV